MSWVGWAEGERRGQCEGWVGSGRWVGERWGACVCVFGGEGRGEDCERSPSYRFVQTSTNAHPLPPSSPRYGDGAKQFEINMEANGNDVEETVWRFMFMAKDQSPSFATREMLSCEPDTRVPMMEIYSLFKGEGSAEAVMSAGASLCV